MEMSRHVLTLLIALMMSSVPMIMLLNGPARSISEEEEAPGRAIPWNQVIPGTEIKLDPGKNSNTSYYYPVPIGATVVSANMSYSNIPYTAGSTRYSADAWLNIGAETKEYVYGNSGEEMFGTWGFQNRTRTLESFIEGTVTASTKLNGRFVLPKNATLTSASFNITGFQRSAEWKDYYLTGDTAGDMVGYSVKDLDGTYVGMGDPGYSTSSGRVFLIYGDSTGIIYTILVTSSVRFDEFGYSLSDQIAITGEKIPKFAVGAPGHDSNRGSVELMDIGTGYISFQTLEGNRSGDRFGEALAVGDLDGDGDDELLVGAPGANSGTGSVHIYHQVQGPDDLVYQLELLTVINGSKSDNSFGKTLSAGDMNNDKKDDMAVASDQDVFVFHGGSPLDTSYDSNFDPLASFPSSTIRAVSFIGQLSGPQGDSLAIGLPDPSRGSVLIHHGGVSYDTSADVTFTAPNGVSNFGQDMDIGYDINGDSIPEIAIGAPGSGTNRGYVGLYSMSSSSPLWSKTSTTSGDNYGYSVAFGTDLRKDGFGDLVVGAPKASNLGWTWVHERFPITEIPPNSPVVYINGEEVWTYDQDHLYEGEVITTVDLSSYINSQIQKKIPSLNTPYDGFIYIDIEVGMVSISSLEGSNQFRIDNFKMVYDMERSTGEIAQAFNNYLSRTDANIDNDLGIIKVPIAYGGSSEGGIRIDDIDVTVDLVPEIEGIPGIIHVDEDSHVMELIDAYLLFQDDLTEDSDLVYQVSSTGVNRTMFKTYINNGRYIAIDLQNGTDSTNWTGEISIIVTATDISGGRSRNLGIDLNVDPVNDPPAITSLPDIQILQGAKLQYLPHAVDVENDDILYSLVNAPENMTIDELGTVIFQPNGWQVGNLEWTLVLGDGMDQRSYVFMLTVQNINDAPIFSTLAPIGAEVLMGETFSFQFNAYDLDPMDLVQYSLPEGPTGSSIAFELGYLTWTPQLYLEEPQKFRVRATDMDGAFSEIIFFVNITFLDIPPTITSDPNTELFDYVEWYYNIWITEPDDDIYFVELDNGPPGMYYDDLSENLLWTPNGSQLGYHMVSIKVSSTHYKVYQNFSVHVSRAPRVWDFRMDTSKDGQKIKGDLVIGGTVSVSPSPLKGIYVMVGDTENFIPLEGESWTYKIDTKEYPDGELVITVKAFDGFENSTAKTITILVANDEEKTSPLLIAMILVAVVLVVLALALAVVLIMRKKKQQEEEEEKKKKLEEIQRSKQDVELFIESSDKVKGDTSVFDQVEEKPIDERRLEAIDDIFSPMAPGQIADLDSISENDIPEDILQKAAVQETIVQQDPPTSPE
ncbi:MAG: FG-GAP repeat protein [Candidatus Thermoplasmatota archaeon]|nr:FG-GAP repeat protein [Candidatus Thermoplasmatota archaeon]